EGPNQQASSTKKTPPPCSPFGMPGRSAGAFGVPTVNFSLLNNTAGAFFVQGLFRQPREVAHVQLHQAAFSLVGVSDSRSYRTRTESVGLPIEIAKGASYSWPSHPSSAS